MGEVGTKLDKTTQAGRDVYVTPEGEYVSEKSTTFKYNDKWINVPSIFNGYRYNDDTIRLMLDEGVVQPTSTHNNKEDAENAARKRSNELEFNKGGTPMMEKQMEMFEDGGLKDEGGMIDKESGNDVPIGSTRKEVRDDIPAKLSEGEFVFPADVVRFIGLEKLMTIRQKAKMGLQRMEEMGQMGNSDEATMPDDMPFGMSDLIIMSPEGKEVEMAEGGVIHAATGVNVTPSNNPTMTNVQKVNNTGSIYTPYTTGASVVPLPTQPVPTKPVVTASGPPKFPEVMGDGAVTMRQYKNAAGYVMMIPHIGDKPMYPVPEGYVLVAEDGTTPEMDKEGIPAENAAETVKPEEPDYGGEVDQFGNPVGSSGSKANLDAARNAYIEYTLDPSKKTWSDTLMEKLPITKLFDFLDKTVSGGGSKIERYTEALRSDFSKMKTSDPKYQETKNLVNAVNEANVDLGSFTKGDVTKGGVTSGVGTGSFAIGLSDEGSDAEDNTPNKSENIKTVTSDKNYNDLDPNVQNSNVTAPTPEDSNEFTGIGYDGGSGTPTPSAVDMGGPDVGGGGNGSGGSSGGSSGNAAGGPGAGNSGSGFGGTGGGPGGSRYNQGGLAGKKPKKKMKTYKKGGLATSKK